MVGVNHMTKSNECIVYSEVDYVIMLDNFNLNKDGSDCCRTHHHYWFTRGRFLIGKPASQSVREYFGVSP